MQEMEWRQIIENVDRSFYHLTGRILSTPPGLPDRVAWLHESAPFSLVVHSADKDPVFLYLNNTGLNSFKYPVEEVLGYPSRFSAREEDRSEREVLLQRVSTAGIADSYNGVRVDKYGTPFSIFGGIVWQLFREDKTVWGQAALFWLTEAERPDWYLQQYRPASVE